MKVMTRSDRISPSASKPVTGLPACWRTMASITDSVADSFIDAARPHFDAQPVICSDQVRAPVFPCYWLAARKLNIQLMPN
jgi:hypothetical protein